MISFTQQIVVVTIQLVKFTIKDCKEYYISDQFYQTDCKCSNTVGKNYNKDCSNIVKITVLIVTLTIQTATSAVDFNCYKTYSNFYHTDCN